MIGAGTTFEINDGGSDAFVAIDAITSASVPDPELGTVPSKTLDIASHTITYEAGLFEPGQVSITYEFTKARKARFDTLVAARAAKQLKVTIPNGSPSWTKTVPVLLLGNKVDTLEADGKVTATLMIQVTGPAV